MTHYTMHQVTRRPGRLRRYRHGQGMDSLIDANGCFGLRIQSEAGCRRRCNFILSQREHVAVECNPAPWIASISADSVSTSRPPFALNLIRVCARFVHWLFQTRAATLNALKNSRNVTAVSTVL
jgi:hypothetical protein